MTAPTDVCRIPRDACIPDEAEHFKCLLISCAYYPYTVYQMCGLLARLYPEQAEAGAHVVQGTVEG